MLAEALGEVEADAEDADDLTLLRGDGEPLGYVVDELPKNEAAAGKAMVEVVFADLDRFGNDGDCVRVVGQLLDEGTYLLHDLGRIPHHVALDVVGDDEIFRLLFRHGKRVTLRGEENKGGSFLSCNLGTGSGPCRRPDFLARFYGLFTGRSRCLSGRGFGRTVEPGFKVVEGHVGLLDSTARLHLLEKCRGDEMAGNFDHGDERDLTVVYADLDLVTFFEGEKLEKPRGKGDLPLGSDDHCEGFRHTFPPFSSFYSIRLADFPPIGMAEGEGLMEGHFSFLRYRFVLSYLRRGVRSGCRRRG